MSTSTRRTRSGPSQSIQVVSLSSYTYWIHNFTVTEKSTYILYCHETLITWIVPSFLSFFVEVNFRQGKNEYVFCCCIKHVFNSLIFNREFVLSFIHLIICKTNQCILISILKSILISSFISTFYVQSHFVDKSKNTSKRLERTRKRRSQKLINNKKIGKSCELLSWNRRYVSVVFFIPLLAFYTIENAIHTTDIWKM